MSDPRLDSVRQWIDSLGEIIADPLKEIIRLRSEVGAFNKLEKAARAFKTEMDRDESSMLAEAVFDALDELDRVRKVK